MKEIQSKDIEKGAHFWAILDGMAAVLMKDKKGEYYVCGGWECAIRESDFKAIQIIDKPDSMKEIDNYYV